jgi:hypothetical protein
VPSPPQVKFYGSTDLPDGPDDSPAGEAILNELDITLASGFTTQQFNGLAPLEIHFLRLLGYCGIAKSSASDAMRHQMRCVLVSIGRLLFPDCRAAIVAPAVELFVCAVLGQFAKECTAFPWAPAKRDDPVPDFLRVFGHAIGAIIPGVFENLGKLAVLADSASADRYAAITGGDVIVRPFSWKQQLLPFLLSPALRARCPVTYAFMRLSPRFRNVRVLFEVAGEVARLAASAVSHPEQTINLDDVVRAAWNLAVDDVLSGVLTPEARRAIAGIRLSDGKPVYAKAFLPNRLECFPMLIVLEALSGAHNEFIRTLQRLSSVAVSAVADTDVASHDEVVHLEPSKYNLLAIHSYHGQLAPDGVPLFDEVSDSAFAKAVSGSLFFVITHPAINSGITVNPSASTESLVSRFRRSYPQTEDLTADQRRALTVHVKAANRAPAVMLLLERVMLSVLAQIRDPPAGSVLISDFCAAKFSDDPLPLLEQAGAAAFGSARNAAGNHGFTMRRLAAIYAFLTEQRSDSQVVPDGCLARVIVANFTAGCEVLPPDIGQHNIADADAMRTLIPKILVDAGVKAAETPLLQFLEQWEPHAILSTGEGDALSAIKTAGKAHPLLVKDIVGFFPAD